MRYLLKLKHDKHIDMTDLVLRQMSGEITRAEVEEKILYYKNQDKL